MNQTKRKVVRCYELDPKECCMTCHNEWDDGLNHPTETEINKDLLIKHCCNFILKDIEKAYIIAK